MCIKAPHLVLYHVWVQNKSELYEYKYNTDEITAGFDESACTQPPTEPVTTIAAVLETTITVITETVTTNNLTEPTVPHTSAVTISEQPTELETLNPAAATTPQSEEDSAASQEPNVEPVTSGQNVAPTIPGFVPVIPGDIPTMPTNIDEDFDLGDGGFNLGDIPTMPTNIDGDFDLGDGGFDLGDYDLGEFNQPML